MHAILLAAGLSSRMGRFKPLLPLAGKPLLRWVVDAYLRVLAPSNIVVVVGHQQELVCESLASTCVRTIFNPDYPQGMLSSVQTGIRAIAGEASAAFVSLGDQPMIQPATIQRLAETFTKDRPLLAQPCHQSRAGHPILISSEGFDEILSLSAGQTLKTFVSANVARTLLVEVDDPGILLDVDTLEDYQRLVQQYDNSHWSDSCSLAAVS